MKTILHCDANNFYASVECRLDPTLKDKCVAVSGNPEKRHGIILAKNQKAKQMGVKTGEVIWEAKRKCPELILVPPQYDRYVEYSKRLFELYTQYTDRVESFGIDECWLDVTGSRRLFGNGYEIAERIRQRVKRETGLTVSVGVSYNKIFAKLGSDYKKPDAVTVISPDDYRDIVWKLSVSDMMMIGRRTAERLKKIGILTIGDLAQTDPRVLQKLLGINGLKLYENANGRGDDDVRLYYEQRIPKSVGNSTTMPRDVTRREEVQAVIMALAEMVAIRLRRHGFRAHGVHFGMKFNDLTYAGKQIKLPYSIDGAGQLRDAAMRLYDAYFSKEPLPIRALSLTAFDLCAGGSAEQLSLFENLAQREKTARLGQSIDALRVKYGYNVLKSASVMEFPFVCQDLEDSDFLPFKR